MTELAKLEDGKIVISIPVEHLPDAVEQYWSCGKSNDRFKVTDTSEFAKSFVRALNAEEEDGTTLVHNMLDAAVDLCVNSGFEGIDMHEDQNP